MRKFSRSKSLTIPTTSYATKTSTRMNDFEEKKKNTKDQANELERIEAMTFCVRGGVLIKYGRRGKPHGAEFKFSSDGRALEWQNIKKKTKKKKTKNDEREYDFENEFLERNGGKGASTSKRASSFYSGGSNTSTLQLRDVVKVTKGRDSAIFDRFPNLHDEKCSFFIEYVEGGGGENDVVANIKSGVAKNTKVRTLNVVAEDEQSRDKWMLGIETTLLIAKGLYYFDGSSGATRLKHVGALATRQRQSFRVNVNASKHSGDVAVAFEERTRDRSKNLFESKQNFIAKEGEDFGSTIKHIRQLSRLSHGRLSDGLEVGGEGEDRSPVSLFLKEDVPESEPSSHDASQPTKNADAEADESSSIFSTENSVSLIGNSRRGASSEGRGHASTSRESSGQIQKTAALSFLRPKDIYVWGNFQGEDDGENTNLLPSMHKGFEHLDPIKVSAGRAHFVGISKGGFLYFWGDKQRFQCGDAVTTGFHDKPNVSHPMKLSFPTDDIHRTEFVDCACGDDYSLALTRDGEIKAWGATGWVEKGSTGRGGSFGSKRIISVPVSLECVGARKVSKIACGPVHCAAICDYGESVYTWGEGVFYALGHGNDSRTLAKPKRVEALVGKTVTAISCGAWHTVACVATNTNRTGGNSLNLANYRSSGVDMVDAFGGDVYVWGDGSEGQLGRRVEKAIKVPTKIYIENDTPSALRNASNADENLVVPERVANVSTSIIKVACGAAYTILLSINGDVFISGKLGKYSSKTFEIIPELSRSKIGNDLVVTRIAAGTDHCLFAASSTSVMPTSYTARKGDGKKREKRSAKLFAIGGNKFGKIGDGTLREAAVPIEIEKLSGMSIKSLACGGSVSAAIVAESGRDKIYKDRKAKKAEMELSVAMNGYQRSDSIVHSNSVVVEGAEIQMKDKKLVGGVLERKKSKLSRISSFLTLAPTATSESSISTGFGGTMTKYREGDDRSLPTYAVDKNSDSKTLLKLSASLRSLASPPRIYEIERLPPSSPILESPASPIPVPRRTPPPRPSVIKPLAPVASPLPPPPQKLEQQEKTNGSSVTASIHPAPAMSSRERLVQLVERNVQDAKLSAKEEAVEKKTMKKKALPQSYPPPPPPPLSVNRHGRNSNSQNPLNPSFVKKSNSDVDIVKTPPPSKKPPPLRATKTTTTTTTTVPKARRKLEKTAAAATATIMSKTTMTETENKWVEEIEPGVFLTFTKLDALRTTVTRVQFARRVFANETQGLKWWQENRARIFRERKLAAPTT